MPEKNMIERLRDADIAGRVQIIEDQYKKNTAFLKKRFPATAALFKHVNCPYRIDLTDSFLSIVHTTSNELCHPAAGLDIFAETLGEWVHDTWVDLFNFRVVTNDNYPVHQKPIKEMHRELMCKFPEYVVRFAQKRINLKELKGGKRFSPPVVFSGIFHGLHIDYFLSRTEVSSLLLVEPEPERFEVSCYFLDYEKIFDRFENVQISVGDDVDSQPIRGFFSSYRVSQQMWVRVLPGYASEKHKSFIESFRMHQTTLASVIYPIEYEMLGIQHAVQNIREKLPLLSMYPKLSRKSKIAIVATGPSLDNDLPWLKKNRDKLIIFAVTSAVSSLTSAGIKPDIQFTLEMNMLMETVMDLELSCDIPTIAPLKANKQTVDYFNDKIHLCATKDKASPVDATCTVPNTAPSTTNFVFSFACLCKPKEIFMLGCDFGYHSLDQHHSRTSVYKNDSFPTQVKGMSQIMMVSNFNKDEFVQSNPFLSHTRLAVENAIRAVGNSVKITNVSDGVKVSGARCKRSKRIKLNFYKDKGNDLRKILHAFKPAEEGGNYQQYQNSGDALLQKLKEEVISAVTLDIFSWTEFSSVIDAVVHESVEKCRCSETDLRIDIFSRLLIDLLSTWYSTIIFFDDEERVEEVYREGLSLFTQAVGTFQWVDDSEFLNAIQRTIPDQVEKEQVDALFSSRDFVLALHELTTKARSKEGELKKDMCCRLLIDHLASWYAKVIATRNLNLVKERNYKTIRLLTKEINQMIKGSGEGSVDEVAELVLTLKTALEESP